MWFPRDKDLAFCAPNYDIFTNIDNNMLAHRALEVTALRRLYLERQITAAKAAMAPASADNPTGWLAPEALKETAQLRAAGMADLQKWQTNERMDDELQKVLRFARERRPNVLREAQKTLDRMNGYTTASAMRAEARGSSRQASRLQRAAAGVNFPK